MTSYFDYLCKTNKINHYKKLYKMKNGIINLGKFTKEDAMRANRMASREMGLENSTGWVAVHKSHKSIKDYTRNPKYKKDYSAE